MESTGLTLYVTVGSTAFTPLINAVLSEPSLIALRSRGFSKLILQVGNSQVDASHVESLRAGNGGQWEELEVYTFKDSLAEDMARADLIVSHAGECLSLTDPHTIISSLLCFIQSQALDQSWKRSDSANHYW